MLLLELPDEIICYVLTTCTHLRDSKDLLGSQAPGRLIVLNFALTCRKAFGLADPFLLSSLTIRRGTQVWKLLSYLDPSSSNLEEADPDARARHVRELALAPYPEEATGTGYNDITDLLLRMSGLERLIIEIPLHYPTEGLDEFQRGIGRLDLNGGLSGCPVPSWSHNLTECHLNFQSFFGGARRLENLDFILFAPRLTKLTLVDAYIDGFTHKGSRFSVPPHISPLRVLNLESCVFTDRGISPLLSIPKALETFTFYTHSMSIDHDSGQSYILGLLAHMLASLASYQRHSLTDLSVQLEGLMNVRSHESSTPPATHISFLRFSNLKKLKLVVPGYDRVDSHGISFFYPRLPASLTHLHIDDRSRRYRPVEYAWLVGACKALLEPSAPSNVGYPSSHVVTSIGPLPDLRSMTITFTPTYDALADPPPERIGTSISSQFTEVGHLLHHRFSRFRSHSVRLRVIRRTDIRSAVPPYLWDQEEPEDVLVYDNTRPENLWNCETPTEERTVKEERRHLQHSDDDDDSPTPAVTAV
ncbi:hypothetical protein DV736_g4811, partial [Chaetothyriales sp. CBS 134916]